MEPETLNVETPIEKPTEAEHTGLLDEATPPVDPEIDDLSDVFGFVDGTWEEIRQSILEMEDTVNEIAGELFQLAASDVIVNNIRQTDTGYVSSMQTFITVSKKIKNQISEMLRAIDGHTGRVQTDVEFSLHTNTTFRIANLQNQLNELLMTSALVATAATAIEQRGESNKGVK